MGVDDHRDWGGEDPDAEAQIKTIRFIMQTKLHFGNRATVGTLKASRDDVPQWTFLRGLCQGTLITVGRN